MKRFKNDCVNCDVHGCETCNRSAVPVWICDHCGDYATVILDGESLCDKCAEKQLELTITEDFNWSEIYRAMFPNNDLGYEIL